MSVDTSTPQSPQKDSGLKPLREGGAEQLPRITTNTLMRGGKRLVIQHNNEDYVLQVTRSGRLILTK